MMDTKTFFFAGGGTGGHIYPAIAVAEKILKLEPAAKIHFFCSSRDIDRKILNKTGFEYTKLPAQAFSLKPDKLIRFATSLIKSYQIAKKNLLQSQNPTIIGAGGFASVPVCLAGYKSKIPIKLINVDIVPGKANKLLARFANEIFVQFTESAAYFKKRNTKVHIVGCPLRSSFEKLQPQKVINQLNLEENKKILLITGASSGAASINTAICSNLNNLDAFAADWQIVHLTGQADFNKVRQRYSCAKISCKILDYFDDMPNLLAAAEMVVGRSGAVSVAEYAAAALPSICIPYPHHKDRHQYLNAAKLAKADAALIINEMTDESQTSQRLGEKLEELMKNDNKRKEMRKNSNSIANKNAALEIAKTLLKNTQI